MGVVVSTSGSIGITTVCSFHVFHSRYPGILFTVMAGISYDRKRKLSSSSDLSKANVIEGNVKKKKSSLSVFEFDNVQNYSLLYLLGHYNIDVPPTYNNETCAYVLVEAMLEDIQLQHPPDITVNQEIFQLRSQAPLLHSGVCQPDLAIYKAPRSLATIIEVHSSPFSGTLQKAIYVCVDVLRYARASDSNINKVSAFVFHWRVHCRSC